MESIANSEKKPSVFVFRNIEAMAAEIFEILEYEFTRAIAEKKTCHIALSGGSTPLRIFEYLARLPLEGIRWEFLHIYWGDERCVPIDDPESNYGNAWKTLLRLIDIPQDNIHRIRGEDDPYKESLRYSDVLRKYPPLVNGFPVFDIVLLGLGEDGHTASIFPDAMERIASNELCYVAEHPQTNQKRISFSLKLINNSKNIVFLVTGASKAKVVGDIIAHKKGFENLPASYVKPTSGELKWFLDEMAGKGLK